MGPQYMVWFAEFIHSDLLCAFLFNFLTFSSMICLLYLFLALPFQFFPDVENSTIIFKRLFVYNRCHIKCIGWLVCWLLAGPDLWKRKPLKCSITMVFTCPLLSLCEISISFRENNVAVFPFPFHISMPLANFRFIRLQG